MLWCPSLYVCGWRAEVSFEFVSQELSAMFYRDRIAPWDLGLED